MLLRGMMLSERGHAIGRVPAVVGVLRCRADGVSGTVMGKLRCELMDRRYGRGKVSTEGGEVHRGLQRPFILPDKHTAQNKGLNRQFGRVSTKFHQTSC